MARPPAIALMGPTASGKSALALEWAERFDGEIVSVDSALVYRGLDIGAAKTTREEQARVRHHLVDVRDPWQPYSAAEFAQDARAAVAGILARGKLPILAGGTGLYFRALLHGLADMPAADPAMRAQLEREAAGRGWAALHAELATVDPAAAARIHATDAQRIQRALEVWRLSGRPISEWQRQRRGARLPARVLQLVLAPRDRSTLHERIERRFDGMLEQGFLDEVRALRHGRHSQRTRRRWSCLRCAPSATARPGSTWMASPTRRPSAIVRSSPPANWPSARSPGCGASSARAGSTRNVTAVRSNRRWPRLR